jgi:hypothetical protein
VRERRHPGMSIRGKWTCAESRIGVLNTRLSSVGGTIIIDLLEGLDLGELTSNIDKEAFIFNEVLMPNYITL